MHLDTLFSGVAIGQAWCFRIMRNADLDLDEEDASDLLEEIEKSLKMRQWGQVIPLKWKRT
jgi:polyphosphate kinase